MEYARVSCVSVLGSLMKHIQLYKRGNVKQVNTAQPGSYIGARDAPLGARFPGNFSLGG